MSTPLIHLHAQGDFAPTGAKWYFSYSAPSESEVGYTTLKSMKDTMIAGQACRMLARATIKKTNGVPNSTIDTIALPPLYSYSVPDTVFYYNEVFDRFLPWYIFNVVEGDTVSYMVPDTQRLSEHPDSLFRVIVDSITELTIEGTSFNQIHFHPLDAYSFGGKFDEGYYLDKLGAGFGPNHQLIDYTADFHPAKLRCYEDDHVSYKGIDVEACDLISDVSNIAEVTAPEKIAVFPNPTSGLLHIRSDAAAIKRVFIYTMLGKEVVHSAAHGYALSFDLSVLPKGLYFLKIETEQNTRIAKINIL